MRAIRLYLNSRFKKSEFTDEVVLPTAMKSSTHCIIHDIVIRRHRVKHSFDKVLLFISWDFLVAEVNSLRSRVGGREQPGRDAQTAESTS